MELFKANLNIDFLGKRYYAIVFSLFLVAASIYIWIASGNKKYGIDFLGGHELVVEVAGEKSGARLAERLETAGLTGAIVQSFEAESNLLSIRVGLMDNLDAKAVRQKTEEVLRAAYGDNFQIIKTDSVGATIGEEVQRNALIAVALGLLGILIYIAFRFEFAFALGAVVAMFHDVIVATGVYLFAGEALNSFALAAGLTIVGYSVNDTIVIFDRVREEMQKRHAAPLAQLINESLNFCLSRTVITSLLTLFATLALLVFGGGAIKDLSIYLVAGLISGVYSTIYIAAPVVLWWENFRKKRRKRQD